MWIPLNWKPVTTSRSPTDGFYSQWWSADEWRGHCLCQRVGKFLTLKVLEDTPAVFIARKALRWTRILIRVDQRSKNPHLIKNGIRTHCNTENFVPIVVPGFSASSSSSLPSSTSMTSLRQEIDHPRLPQARLPHHPWHLQLCQAKVWLGQERRDPCHSEIPEWLQVFRENIVDDRVPEDRDSHASFSHGSSSEPTPARSLDLGKHSVYSLPERPKLRNLPEDQNHKGPMQKTPLAES